MSRKRQQLAASGTLNPMPEKVQDHLFQSYAFFDPDDALQVKYEMLRRVERAGRSVTQATQDFGFSRRHFYDLQHQFAAQGFQGLVPKKRGPKGAYKLTDDVVDFLERQLAGQYYAREAEARQRFRAGAVVDCHLRAAVQFQLREKLTNRANLPPTFCEVS